MEVLRNLFEGYPNLWGGGVAHSVLILSLTIAFGIILAKIKVRGVSLGSMAAISCPFFTFSPSMTGN